MENYADLNYELIETLNEDCKRGPLLENGQRYFVEAKYGMIIDKIKVSTFPNEIEPPHFRLDFQGKNCRYNLFTGEPIDSVPREISKYSRNINKWYKEQRENLIKFYTDNLSDTAPIQARVQNR